MKSKKSILSMLRSVFVVILGNMTFALAIKLFLLPGGFITGGTTGIALTVTYFFDINMSLFILIFNIIMLLTGLVLLGKKFAVTTIISSFAYPAALELYDRVLGDLVLTTDPLLCTAFAGLGIGIGLSIVIREGASTGGMDIPPLVLNKYFKVPVSLGMNLFDSIILLSQLFYNPFEKVLYGILLMFVYTTVIDRVMLNGASRTEVTIVSKKSREIANAILKEVNRGCTMIYGEGGYTQEQTQIVLSVISNRELPKLERLVYSIDPECFMVANRVNEVHGVGFTIDRY